MAMLASCYKKRNNSKICLSPQGSEKKMNSSLNLRQAALTVCLPGPLLVRLSGDDFVRRWLAYNFEKKIFLSRTTEREFFEPWARCLTTRSVCSLMNLLMEDIDTRKQIFFFFFERLWRHLQEFHSKKCLHFRNSARGNHCNDVSKNENLLFCKSPMAHVR